MTVRTKRMLCTLISGSALAIAPLTFSTVVLPAVSSADVDCENVAPRTAEADGCAGNGTQAKPQSQGLTCADGQIVDAKNGQCVALLDGITKQLQALPPPPALAGLGGDGLGGLGGLPLGQVSPTLVLPSVGFQVVPNVNLTPDLGLGALAGGLAAGLPSLPAPSLPNFNPLNPLGLPPPPF